MTAYDDQLKAFSRTSSTLVDIELDSCLQEHGQSPCLASGAPCYKTLKTCQFKSAYVPGTRPIKLCLHDTPQPQPGEIIRPYILSITELSQEILPAESLLINQRMTITMLDEPDSDVGIDPYRVSPALRQSPGGTEVVTTAGTFWRKVRARNPHYKNRRVTVRQGWVADGFSKSDYKITFVGVIDNIQVGSNGQVTMIVKGLLQQVDVEYPKKTDGAIGPLGLAAAEVVSMSLTAWSGVDRYALVASSVYDAAGIVVVDGEVIGYASLGFDSSSGIATLIGLTRGMYNNYGYAAATSHDAGAEVQQGIFLMGNPIDLMRNLINLAGITNAEINVAAFDALRDTWFQGVVFATVLYEKGTIKSYLKELREQTLTILWQDENQLINIRSVNPNSPGISYRRITDAANVVYASRSIDDNEGSRVTRAVVWYDIYPQKSGSDNEHFRSAAVVVDADAESAVEYNEQRDNPPIRSRWIKALHGGELIARLLASRIVRRLRNGAKSITFELDLKDDGLVLGEIFELLTASITNYNGNPMVVKYIATKKQRRGNTLIVTAFDVSFAGRPMYIAPNTVSTNYLTASETDRTYCYISGGSPPSPGNGDEPYTIV